MRFVFRLSLVFAAALILGAVSPCAAADADPSAEAKAILAKNCLKCHGDEKQQGGLRFDSAAGLTAKGESGDVAVVPGKPDDSELVRRITSKDKSTQMPPEGDRLSAADVAALRRWIEDGAKFSGTAANDKTGRQELVVTDDDRRHWSFRPLAAIAPPAVKNEAWCRTPIDRFILAGLEAQGLAPTPTANQPTLVRRAYFDLVGLPPSPDELQRAAAETSLAPLVDRLLATRHYGERWGRHWLDVARYADSNGQEGDQDRPNAFQYRDFVIRALNDDLPFDTFVRWQLAGDEYEPDNPAAVSATGFLVAGPHTVLDVPMEEEKVRNRYNEYDDLISTLGTGFLGLTLGCARCHDHKYDAVPTRDYYRLLAAFHSGTRDDVWLGTRAEIDAYRTKLGEWEKKSKAAESELEKWLSEIKTQVTPQIREKKIAALPIGDNEQKLLRDDPRSDAAKALAKKHEEALKIGDDEIRAALNDEQRRRWDELAAAVKTLRDAKPAAPPAAWAFKDTSREPKTTWLFRRGDFKYRDEPVTLGLLSVLTTGKSVDDYWRDARQQPPLPESTQQRKSVAAWITDVEHGAGPLAARVIVNRLWQHHFGEGLVATPGDFGVQGARPSHPELLEWLAHDLVSNGWRLKRLHRMIMESAAYQQGIAYDAAQAKVDPDNRLLWRRRPRRLEAEIARDAMLAASGTLNLEPFGPAFKPAIAAQAMVARNLKDGYPGNIADGPAVRRRTVYMFHKRVVPYPLLQAFDRPDASQSCSRRDRTTVAPQALALLNDQFVRNVAVDFAKRVEREAKGDAAAAIDVAYRLALARPPKPTELTAAQEFLTEQTKRRNPRDRAAAGQQALADFCQTLLSLNEFLYVD